MSAQCNFQPEFLNSFTVVQRQIGFVFQSSTVTIDYNIEIGPAKVTAFS